MINSTLTLFPLILGESFMNISENEVSARMQYMIIDYKYFIHVLIVIMYQIQQFVV